MSVSGRRKKRARDVAHVGKVDLEALPGSAEPAPSLEGGAVAGQSFQLHGSRTADACAANDSLVPPSIGRKRLPGTERCRFPTPISFSAENCVAHPGEGVDVGPAEQLPLGQSGGVVVDVDEELLVEQAVDRDLADEVVDDRPGRDVLHAEPDGKTRREGHRVSPSQPQQIQNSV